MTLPRRLYAIAPFAFAIVLTSSAFLACSSDDSTSPGGSDAGTTSEGGSTPETGSPEASTTDSSTTTDAADAAGGACSTVVNGGALVSEVAGAGAKPAPAGGAIADGTYFLTNHDVYPPSSPDGNTRRRTIKFTGNKVETAENDTGKPEARLSGTYTTSGTMITFSITCPATGTVTLPYTATATTFATFSESNDVFTSTKQ